MRVEQINREVSIPMTKTLFKIMKYNNNSYKSIGYKCHIDVQKHSNTKRSRYVYLYTAGHR